MYYSFLGKDSVMKMIIEKMKLVKKQLEQYGETINDGATEKEKQNHDPPDSDTAYSGDDRGAGNGRKQQLR